MSIKESVKQGEESEQSENFASRNILHRIVTLCIEQGVTFMVRFDGRVPIFLPGNEDFSNFRIEDFMEVLRISMKR